MEMEPELTAGPAPLLPIWLQFNVQSGIWAVFCGSNVDNCKNVYFSEEGKIPGIDSQFSWLLGPCFYHALTCVVHLLFLLIWSSGIISKGFNNLFRSGAAAVIDLSLTGEQRVNASKPSNYFTFGNFLCSMLSMLNLMAGVNDVFISSIATAPLHVTATAWTLAVAWFVLMLTINTIRKEEKEKLPLLVRVWWIASFVLSLLSLIPNFLSSKENEQRYPRAGLETMRETLFIPMTAYLCVLAIFGQTGITTLTNGSLNEPLLRGATTPLNEESTEKGPGVSPSASASIFV